MRTWLSRAGQGRVVALLALALFVRALVPAGWMPVAGPHGVHLALCPDQAPVAHAAPGHHGGGEHGEAPAPDQPCAFAGLGLAADAPPPLLVIAPASIAAAPVQVLRTAVAVGRGLAAPPPPATGPPAFA
jgi:hypothetical protein